MGFATNRRSSSSSADSTARTAAAAAAADAAAASAAVTAEAATRASADATLTTAAAAAQTTANAAIPKSTVTTSGDVIYATGSAALTRLGKGSNGQVLTLAAGLPSWADSAAAAVTAATSVKVTKSAVQSIASSTATKLTWDTEEYDSGTLHDTVTNNERLVAPVQGVYLATLHVLWASSATGGRIVEILNQAGASLGAQTGSALVGATNTHTTVSVTCKLAASNYVEAFVTQTAGSPLDVSSGVAGSSFALTLLGSI